MSDRNQSHSNTRGLRDRRGGQGDRRNRPRTEDVNNPRFLKDNPEYHGIYLDLMKTANMWEKSGQYLMASEDYRRAKCLEHGNVKAYEHTVKPETLYMSTRKNKYSPYVTPTDKVVEVTDETCIKRKWPLIR